MKVKNFLLPFYSPESIVFNIELITQIIIISIYSTQKDTQNHLLVEYLSGKSQKSFTIFTLTFNPFLSRYLFISPITFFGKEQLFYL